MSLVLIVWFNKCKLSIQWLEVLFSVLFVRWLCTFLVHDWGWNFPGCEWQCYGSAWALQQGSEKYEQLVKYRLVLRAKLSNKVYVLNSPPINQPANQAISQPTNQPANQAINYSTNQSITQATINQPIHQSINQQSVNQSISRPTNQSNRQSVSNQSITQPTNQSVNQVTT